MSDDPFFDAMPKSTPDEYGSWAKGKTQDIRDAFPTPEAFKTAAERFAASGGGAIEVATISLAGLEAEFARAIEEMKR